MLVIQRREFLGLFAAAGVARALGRVGPAAPPALRISITTEDRDIERGAAMAVDEAQRAASLFGGTVAIGDGPGLRVAIGGIPTRPVHDIHMNVVGLKPEARACVREVFHIASGSSDVTWLPTLTRFGADSLNKRYRARYQAGMSAAAWSAWFAVKCAWEAALKSRASDTTALIAYLESPAARFDGHKGVALYFDAAHVLKQPIYDDKGNENFQDNMERACVWK
jgi:hypothetical protein